jgi:hypothetical protein
MKLIDSLVAKANSVLREEPARLFGTVAAVLTIGASALQAGDVHTWQAALPVLLAEIIRRNVNSPAAVADLIELVTSDEPSVESAKVIV